MDERRRRMLRAVAALSMPTVAGCAESSDGQTAADSGTGEESGTDDAGTNATGRGNATTADWNGIDALTAESEEFARLVFEERADERAHARFTEQARRLFRPSYVERLRLGATAIGGPFRSIDGRVDQSTGGSLTVTLDLSFRESSGQLVVSGDPDGLSRARLDGEYRQPKYVDRSTFETEERTLRTGSCELPATVAVPTTGELVAGVVVVPGDGVIDRNFTTGGTAMYRDLAEGLASTGIATIQYDKRTFACELEPSSSTLDEEVTDDALSAIEELRTVEGVRSDRIVVLGHSLGGMAAPRIAARDGDLVGIVGLATPARPLQQLAVSQTEYLAELLEHGDEIASRLPTVRSAAERVAAGEYDSDERVLGRTGSFWDSLRSYDHLEIADSLSIPRLYVQGGHDFQVDPEADFGRLRSRLQSSGGSFERYPTLNHRCMPTNGPSVVTEYRMPNNVSATLLADLAEWIDGLF